MSEVDLGEFKIAAEGADPLLEPATAEEIADFRSGLKKIGLRT